MSGDRSAAARGQDRLWYRDAIIYQLHVKTFFDGNGDGVGDFDGLIAKLDYFVDLGVTCLWLLPFYQSPQRDDGYDISHYERVHAPYGSLADVDRFIAAAHRRGLRVITELVINHTSDQHPWFQAARRAPAGSAKRDFYVWSDTDQRYAAARVIFPEAERSNWTWDREAGAYYWHRFFAHQPDLNFDNPRVRRAVIKVMRFWLDRGVDGLRLDAIPYLFERDGTTCDNLPETHRFIKALRAEIDARYADRVLLAEANHWPADVRPYFGDGDECHMAFHFPLMPRLFVALKRGEAFPIVDILQQTQDLPAQCQWAVFLRNHDELTLTAVTDDERDFMFREYAADPRVRLNHGIRRRLAPLLDNSPRRIELVHAILLSVPGTPVLYYGDEIGMGDAIHLGDRTGVRTPMQWNDDAWGGFCGRASDVVPILPPIDDPVYGFRRINVEAQGGDPDSLRSRIKRLIHARRRLPIFGRGSIDCLECGNRHVLAFARRWDSLTVIVVANLTATAQPVFLRLGGSATGAAVVEMLDEVPFPPASEAYPLTLGPFGWYWLQVDESRRLQDARVSAYQLRRRHDVHHAPDDRAESGTHDGDTGNGGRA